MMKNHFLKALLLVAALCALLASPANAVVTVDLSKGNVEPLPIAITDLQSGNDMGAQVAAVITADLKRSGLFAPIDKGAFIQKITNPDAAPRFEDWKTINAQALVTGRVTQEADGRLRAEFRLWDTFGGSQLIGQQALGPHPAKASSAPPLKSTVTLHGSMLILAKIPATATPSTVYLDHAPAWSR